MYLPRPNLAHLEGCRYVYVCVYVFDFCKNFVGTLNIMLDIIVLWGILLYFQSLMYTFNKSLKSSWYKKHPPLSINTGLSKNVTYLTFYFFIVNNNDFAELPSVDRATVYYKNLLK